MQRIITSICCIPERILEMLVWMHLKANVIYQLSWNGKPINKFETDYPLTNFCVSDNDDVLYALADKGEVELVQYTLK